MSYFVKVTTSMLQLQQFKAFKLIYLGLVEVIILVTILQYGVA